MLFQQAFSSLILSLVVFPTLFSDGSPLPVDDSKPMYKIVDDSLYKIDKNATFPNHEVFLKALRMPQSRVVPYIESSRQKEVWDFIATFDSYKTSPSYSNLNGRPTLQSFKYVIVPIWWNDMDTSNLSFQMDPTSVVASFETNQQYYIDMSWGKMTAGVEYTALEQKLFSISSEAPSFGDTESSTRSIVDAEGLVKDVDYNGICLMYFTSQSGPFSGAGGWGDVNSDGMYKRDID